MQAKVKNRVFVKLDSRYTYYFPEYAKYFGRALRLLQSMYGMNDSGKLFSDELKEWLLEAYLNVRFLSIISIHHMDQKIVLSYVDDCFYWYNYEALGKWFVDTLG